MAHVGVVVRRAEDRTWEKPATIEQALREMRVEHYTDVRNGRIVWEFSHPCRREEPMVFAVAPQVIETAASVTVIQNEIETRRRMFARRLVYAGTELLSV